MNGSKKAKTAKKPARKAEAAPAPKPQMRPEELAQAFRQSYTPPPPPSTVTVTLDPDVAPHFQSARAVNEALRALLRIVKQVRG